MNLCFLLTVKQSSDDEDPSGKARSRHIAVNKADLANSIEVLESFKLARESWELLYSLESLDKGKANCRQGYMYLHFIVVILVLLKQNFCHWDT